MALARTFFARLIEQLSRDGARVIGIDVIMSEPYPGDEDMQLARSARRFGSVIFPSKFEESTRKIQWEGKTIELKEEIFTGPVNIIAESGDVGYMNLPHDSDGFIRRFTPVRLYREQLRASFDLKIAAHYLEAKWKYIPYEVLRLGDRSIPLDRHDSAYINFAGPAGTFKRISFHQVLNSQFPTGFFNAKIVLVGATFLDSHDFFPTPYMERERGKRYPLSGVEIRANIINTILQKRFLISTSPLLNCLIIFLSGVVMTFLTLKLSPLKGAFIVSFNVLAYLSISMWLFSKDILLVTISPVMTSGGVFLAQVVIRYFMEEKEKRQIRNLFQKYVSPDVVDTLIQDPVKVKLGGEEKVLSVLFSDLIGFTSYSEHFDPHEMVTILSEYFGEMTEQVFANQGTLVEYVGDELMAIFGAPLEQADHAERACNASLAMQERLRLLRQAWSEKGRPALRARIGINSGPMLVGNLGSPYRFSYGVLGDHVNLASRLEGLNNFYSTEILIGENTAQLVKGSFLLREVDWVRVKGREQPVSIYELVALSGASLQEERVRAISCYAEGLKTYRQQRWEESLGYFEKALSFYTADGPSSVMAHRCRVYRERPPEGEWDGVFQQLTKR